MRETKNYFINGPDPADVSHRGAAGLLNRQRLLSAEPSRLVKVFDEANKIEEQAKNQSHTLVGCASI